MSTKVAADAVDWRWPAFQGVRKTIFRRISTCIEMLIRAFYCARAERVPVEFFRSLP